MIPPFQVGDRVRIIADGVSHGMPIGSIQIITKVNKASRTDFTQYQFRHKNSDRYTLEQHIEAVVSDKEVEEAIASIKRAGS